MKEQVAITMAGLMLLTAGCENTDGKNPFNTLAARMQTTKPEKIDPQDIGEKNIHNQWQGRSNPSLYHGGFLARADFLYWRADEEGLQYGFTTNVNTSIPKSTNHLESPSVKWSPGFRVGVGYTFSTQDYWDLNALWTHFQTHQSGSKSVNVSFSGSSVLNAIIPWWGSSILGTAVNQASVQWKLHYNIYDLDLGRDYFIAKSMTAHPFVGIRGGTINQKYHAHYRALVPNLSGSNDLVPTAFKADTDFWGLGLHVGSGLAWHISSCFSLVGNVGGSFLYGDFSIKEKISGLQLYAQSGKVLPSTFNNRLTTGAVNLEAILGFQWEEYFYQDKYRLAIKVGYEWSEWFSQNRMIKIDSITDASNQVASVTNQSSGNLALQGANVQVRWDF